jgi:hypothetical protein
MVSGVRRPAVSHLVNPREHADERVDGGLVGDVVEVVAAQLAQALNAVRIDVLAERLSTNRCAPDKTLHDVRHKLRKRLDAHDLSVDAPFEEAH